MKTLHCIALILLPVISFGSNHAPTLNKKHNTGPATNHHGIARKSFDRSVFFSLKLTNGEQIGNIFSRAIAYWGKDFKDNVARVSGTATYTVVDNDPLKPTFSSTYNYDGLGKGGGKVQITDDGSKTHKPGSSDSRLYSDGSGIMYNSFVWGQAPQSIYKGETWEVNIAAPWELGGPGKQTVTVLQIDVDNHTVTLEREGTSEGFYADDRKELDIKTSDSTLHVKLTPGKSHWRGYTIVKDGLIVSDELMVIRPVEFSHGEQKFEATEREYFLLNQMPVFDE